MKAPKLKRIVFDDGVLTNGFLTRDRTLLVEGTTVAKATVTIFDNGVKIGTAKADKAGNWSFTTGTLADGSHGFTATAKLKKDKSKPSTELKGVVDATAPAKPGIDLLSSSDTGFSSVDNITSDSTPTLGGTAAAGSTVTLREGSTVLGTLVADGSGNWSITSTVLSEGDHTITATAKDAAGNESAASSAITITVDTTVPSGATGLDLAAADDSGTSNGDDLTRETSGLTISGSGTNGTTVTLFDDADNDGVKDGGETVLGTGTVSGGAFSIDIALGDGLHHVRGFATDAAGNAGLASSALDLTVDTTLPEFVKLTEPVSGAGGDNSFEGSLDHGVAIIRSSSILTADDTDGGPRFDLFSADLTSGARTLLTGSVAGGFEGNSSFDGWSLDGNIALLHSGSTLTDDDTDGGTRTDLFSIDLTVGAKTLLTASMPGGFEGHSLFAGWGPDENTAIVYSTSTLTADDTDGGAGQDLFAINLVTGARILLTGSVAGGLEDSSDNAYWSPDGAVFIVRSGSTLTADDIDGGTGGGDLFSIDLTTGAKVLLTGSIAGGYEGSSQVVWWSPDGSSVIVDTMSALTADDTDGTQADLFAVNLVSGAKILLTGTVAGGFDGSVNLVGWSPDGNTAVVTATSNLTADDTDDNSRDLFAIDLDSGTKTLLTGLVAGEFIGELAGWSLDGDTAIIRALSTVTADDTDGGAGADLVGINLTTGVKTLITGSVPGGNEGDSWFNGWSPDGNTAIIFSSSTLTVDDIDGPASYDLFAMEAATGAMTLLTGSVAGGYEGFSAFAGWSPDGTTAIIYSTSALTADDTDGGTGFDYFAIDLATGTKTALTGSGGYEGESQPVWDISNILWDADGESIEIVTNSSLTVADVDVGGFDLYVVNTRTGDRSLVDLGLAFEAGASAWGQGVEGEDAVFIGYSSPITGEDYFLLT